MPPTSSLIDALHCLNYYKQHKRAIRLTLESPGTGKVTILLPDIFDTYLRRYIDYQLRETESSGSFISKETKAGIYRITNLVNQRFYIGSSFNISKRILQHLIELREKKHINTSLQKDFDLYKENNFTIFTIELTGKTPQAMLQLIEEYHILSSDALLIGYNKMLPTDNYDRWKDCIDNHQSPYDEGYLEARLRDVKQLLGR